MWFIIGLVTGAVIVAGTGLYLYSVMVVNFAAVLRKINIQADLIDRQCEITAKYDREETLAKQQSRLPTTVELSLSHINDTTRKIRLLTDDYIG